MRTSESGALSMLMVCEITKRALHLHAVFCAHLCDEPGEAGGRLLAVLLRRRRIIGGWRKSFLDGAGTDNVRADCGTIPELLHFTYQMMFFLITPGLFIG